MKNSLFFLILFFIQLQTYAQKEAINWYFGNKAGLNFSKGYPAPTSDGAMVTHGASAVISDKNTGELLFYTNGRNIWNRKHQLMPNGQDFPPGCSNSVSQAALIVPVPENEHLYYVFSIFLYHTDEGGQTVYPDCIGRAFPRFEYSCEVRYSVVDMRLNGGMGDVVTDQKNIVLQRNSTEKLTAIPHSNGRDFWLFTHEWDSDAFYVRLISGEGIAQPSVQHIGSAHRRIMMHGEYTSGEIRGIMKASPNGRKLACAVTGMDFTPGAVQRPLDLFDFDPATGRLSNYIMLDNLGWKYGVSFSPDNTKLYASGYNFHPAPIYDYIWQYDLSAGDAQAIKASGMSIVIDNPYTNLTRDAMIGHNIGSVDLQLASDGKIYAADSPGYGVEGRPQFSKSMVVINKPNEKGFACDVNYRVFDLADSYIALGLPNFIQSYFDGLEAVNQETQGCKPIIKLYPNPTTGKVRLTLAGDCALDQEFRLEIINSIGQVFGKDLTGLTIHDEVDISKYASGLYLFVLTFPDGRQVVEKVVKVN